jgi:hypothetical protein
VPRSGAHRCQRCDQGRRRRIRYQHQHAVGRDIGAHAGQQADGGSRRLDPPQVPRGPSPLRTLALRVPIAGTRVLEVHTAISAGLPDSLSPPGRDGFPRLARHRPDRSPSPRTSRLEWVLAAPVRMRSRVGRHADGAALMGRRASFGYDAARSRRRAVAIRAASATAHDSPKTNSFGRPSGDSF